MNTYKPLILFYTRIFLIILLVNVVLYVLFGMYLSNYEVYFSALLHGTYTHPWGYELDYSSHLLILYVYEFFQSIFKEYNVYGLILVLYNFLGFIFTGLVLYRILKINLKIDSLLVFLLLYLILVMSNFINVNSTRQTFVFLVAIVGFIESRRAEKKEISIQLWCWISLYYVLVSFIRFESVWLFGWIYLIAVLLLRKFHKFVLLPLVISGIFLLVFYNILVPRMSEAKQAFIYKELEFFDRLNIDYEHLSVQHKREVDAIFTSGIQPRLFFTLDFYDSISKYNANNNIFSLSDGIEMDAFRNTFHQSKQYFKIVRPYIILYLFTSVLLLWYLRPFNKRTLLFVIVIAAIPLALCLHIVVPRRFLVPYFTTFSVFNLVWIYKQAAITRYLNSALLLFIIFFANLCWQQKQDYVQADLKFKETSGKLLALSSGQKHPVIINSIYYDGFFPTDPLSSFPRQNALFLNFYYFTGWDMNVNRWKEVCGCNPLYFKEKVDYLASSQNLFIIDQKSFDYMQKYLKDKFGMRLQKKDVGQFNADLKVCRLNFEPNVVH